VFLQEALVLRINQAPGNFFRAGTRHPPFDATPLHGASNQNSEEDHRMPPIALKPRRFSRVTTPAMARTVVLLVLAATAAVTSLPRRADDVQQQIQWLLLASVAPEASATAGAIGESPNFPVSP
jgi:hypothetical protein